jgi:hypothetical protein
MRTATKLKADAFPMTLGRSLSIETGALQGLGFFRPRVKVGDARNTPEGDLRFPSGVFLWIDLKMTRILSKGSRMQTDYKGSCQFHELLGDLDCITYRRSRITLIWEDCKPRHK